MSTPKSLYALGVAIEGVMGVVQHQGQQNESVRLMVDVVRGLVEQGEAMEKRIAALEAETKRLRGES